MVVLLFHIVVNAASNQRRQYRSHCSYNVGSYILNELCKNISFIYVILNMLCSYFNLAIYMLIMRARIYGKDQV